MKKLYFIIFLAITFIYSDETRWSSTRFEHWWNKKFNSTIFRESFSFMPYRIKVGTFQYGGDDYWKQYFSEGSTSLNNSPFITKENFNYNFIDDINNRKGIDLEIDFLGYNFFRKLQNSVDIISSFSYRLSKPLNKTLALGWPNDSININYYYYPVLNTYSINNMFSIQISENFSPYFCYSYGLVNAQLFRDENNNGIIKASGKSQSFDLGFHVINEIKNKNYNLIYGFELGLDEIQIDDISDLYSNPILAVNSNNIAFRFTIGIIYGGRRTNGDKGFRYLIDSDYVDAIDEFKKFKINHSKHPKINLANKMINFSNSQIAYDMLYNGIDHYRNNNVDSSLIWYDKALDKAKDSTLIYEIQSRKYIIADELLSNLDDFYYKLSINDKIEYLEYIENISHNIKSSIEPLKVDLMYKKADSFLKTKEYFQSYELYQKIKKMHSNYEYIYEAKINTLVSILIEDINQLINNKSYFQAYESTKFLNLVYSDINNYIDDNLNILKNQLDFENSKRRSEIFMELINDYKSKFDPIDSNTLIQLGDSYSKSRRLLGKPIELKNRQVGNNSYFMAVYNYKDKVYRLFFENEILFEIIKE